MSQLGDQVHARTQERSLEQAARDICTKVKHWRNDRRTASRRWIWEMLQNAVDAAAEAHTTAAISVVFRQNDSE
jgi:hypothetical protein